MRLGGFEPPTGGLEGRCSSTELQAPAGSVASAKERNSPVWRVAGKRSEGSQCEQHEAPSGEQPAARAVAGDGLCPSVSKRGQTGEG